jgi:hypothetical protein
MAEEKRAKLLMSESTLKLAERDPLRLLRGTDAYENNKVNIMDLDKASRRRSTAGAHEKAIALGGYDLKFTGRSKPGWCKQVSF